MTVAQSDVVALAFVGFVGLLILRRAVRMMRGVPVSPARLAVLPVFYVVFYAVELLTIGAVQGARGPEALASLGVDLALGAVGVGVGYRLTRAHVQLYRPDGEATWYFRLRPTLPVVYVALFFVRATLEVAVVGESPFVFPSTAVINALPSLAWLTLLAVDALWGGTTGLLLGRSAGVYRAWQLKAAEPPATDAALP